MQFFLPFPVDPLEPKIRYEHEIYLTGSCFTEHMSRFFSKAKFRVMDNSHGILFNPYSVCRSLHDVIEKKVYTSDDLFFLDEYWHSWQHHSAFSALHQDDVLQKINQTIDAHHQFLQTSHFIIITLGSAFAYYLLNSGFYVSNNHRAPQGWFRKDLLQTDEIVDALQRLQTALHDFNPHLKIIFTVSPVRHIRDGVIENNRSKARLLEAVHRMQGTYYFPAYEIMIDELRDYRFYDSDLVHPNYAATQYIWEKFVAHCIDKDCYPGMLEAAQINKALHHRPKSTESKAHQQFLHDFFQKTTDLSMRYPMLDFTAELRYFGKQP